MKKTVKTVKSKGGKNKKKTITTKITKAPSKSNRVARLRRLLGGLSLRGNNALLARIRQATNMRSVLPHKLRQLGATRAVNILRVTKARMLATYLYGLLYPDQVVNENLSIKIPSPIPIPTSCWRFRQLYTINPGSTGRFTLYWNPAILGSAAGCTAHMSKHIPSFMEEAFCSHLYVCNSDLDGTNPKALTVVPFDRPLIPFNKYRLTSAMIKVKYIGNIMTQSGTMSACATYVKAPFFMGKAGTSYTIGPGADVSRMVCNFNVIRNGQWSQLLSINSHPDGISCLYVPTDPLSNVFCQDGRVVSEANVETNVTLPQIQIYPANTNLAYSVCGEGLDPSGSIQIEMFYNYEVIPLSSDMPLLGGNSLADSSVSVSEADSLVAGVGRNMMNMAVAPTGKYSPTSTSFISKLGDSILRGAKKHESLVESAIALIPTVGSVGSSLFRLAMSRAPSNFETVSG